MILGLLHEAWVSIGASRLRTFLAMLGIVIGVGSVVLMLAVGAGSRKQIEDAIAKLGSNLLIVTPGSMESAGLRSNAVSRLTPQDATAIGTLSTMIAAAPATSPREFQAASGKLNWSTRVTGTTGDYFAIRNWPLADGEPFSAEDERLGRRVAVIGQTVADRLFPGENPVGRSLRINGTPFAITGLLTKKGQDFNGRDQDDAIFIPLSTAQNKLWGNMYYQGIVQMIFAQVYAKEAMGQGVEDITALLRQRHKLRETMGNDFTVHNLTSITQVATETTRALSLLLGAIASISLIVGGIGIMNIMLVTVTERTREIGIRKALGATEKQIMLQFLMEALIISAAGSLIGLALGYGGGFAAARWGIEVEYTLWSVLLSLAVAAGVGIASGLYPARKAANLQPIEALRMVGA